MNATSSTDFEPTAILLCPRAGRLRDNSAVYSRIIGSIRGQALAFEVTTQAELGEACGSVFARQPARVVVLGGDGSLMRTLSALHRAYGTTLLPRIVLIPLGTVNLTATRFGIRGRPEVLLEKALKAAPNRIESTQSLKVTLDDETFLGFTFGTGLISHFFEAYEAEPKQGLGVAAKMFCQTFFGSLVGSRYARRILSPVRARLILGALDCGELELTLLVSSVFRELGLGLKPTYRAGTVPGQLHVVGSTLKAHRLGPLALRVLRGKPLGHPANFPEVIDRMSEQFCLELAQTTDVVLDGDPIAAHRVVVTVGPQLSFERY